MEMGQRIGEEETDENMLSNKESTWFMDMALRLLRKVVPN